MKHVGCALLLLLAGCASFKSTDDIPAVSDFNALEYMGEWYEIARLPNLYETDLENVVFKYTKIGATVDFSRRGVREGRERILSARGGLERKDGLGEFRFEFRDDFGAFHRIIWISPKYDAAIMTGDNRADLWILSRKKQMPKADLDKLIEKAMSWGFDTTELEYTVHK